jgi:imidazolonepropionase-like amidohydrolase
MDVNSNREFVSNEPGPTYTPGRQARSGTTPWLNSVKLALELFEKTLNSVPAPGLRGIIGGILKIMEKYDVSNSRAFDLLITLIIDSRKLFR